MKKIILVMVLVMSLMLTGCEKEPKVDNNKENEVAIKFKNEYESYNGKENSNGVKYRSVNIPSDNPFVYATAEEIVKMVEDKKTFVVYFGFSTCPWCRSILPTLINVSKDLNIDKIYYVDIYDIRDTYTLNTKNKPELTKEGSTGYMALLDTFKSVLSDYTLTTKNNKTVKVGEKRIYAPNVISVVDGEIKDLTTGISSKQTDAYMELTEEMLNETYEKLECVLSCVKDNENNICTTGC